MPNNINPNNFNMKPIITHGNIIQTQSNIPFNPINMNMNNVLNYNISQGVLINPLKNNLNLNSFQGTNEKVNNPIVYQNNQFESKMNLSKFRTKPCRNFHSAVGCNRGEQCHFIHDPKFAGTFIPNFNYVNYITQVNGNNTIPSSDNKNFKDENSSDIKPEVNLEDAQTSINNIIPNNQGGNVNQYNMMQMNLNRITADKQPNEQMINNNFAMNNGFPYQRPPYPVNFNQFNQNPQMNPNFINPNYMMMNPYFRMQMNNPNFQYQATQNNNQAKPQADQNK